MSNSFLTEEEELEQEFVAWLLLNWDYFFSNE